MLTTVVVYVLLSPLVLLAIGILDLLRSWVLELAFGPPTRKSLHTVPMAATEFVLHFDDSRELFRLKMSDLENWMLRDFTERRHIFNEGCHCSRCGLSVYQIKDYGVEDYCEG